MDVLDVNTIQEIHDNAFNSCKALQGLGDMPALRTIGVAAFYRTPLMQLPHSQVLAHSHFMERISRNSGTCVYVETKDLDTFFDSESVKCFDKNYALKLTLLYPREQQDPPPRPILRCAGGFRTLKGGWASNGRLRDQGGVQVVRFAGKIVVSNDDRRLQEPAACSPRSSASAWHPKACLGRDSNPRDLRHTNLSRTPSTTRAPRRRSSATKGGVGIAPPRRFSFAAALPMPDSNRRPSLHKNDTLTFLS